jgi:surface protein
MFSFTRAFNGDISAWDVSSVTDMNSMFSNAISFNGDISEWDVSSVTVMSRMFSYATSFNGDISEWDVSSVTDMNLMFSFASLFDGDVLEWDVSSVVNMDCMFCETSFKQTLCGAAWVHSMASKSDMFAGSSGSISRTVCLTERELMVVNTPIPVSVSAPAITSTIANTMTCSKCGTFKKSDRGSCCAPGGAWYKNCGGAANKNVDHRWVEGVKACKRKLFKTNDM